MRAQADAARAAVDGLSGPRATATAAVVDEVLRFVRLIKANQANPAGLDRASWLLLWPLTDGPKRLGELADARAVDQSTVSRQAAELVKIGLVRRDPDPADRRARLFALTERGRALCEQLSQHRLRAVAAALAEWDFDRIDGFARMFGDFNQALERRAAENQDADNPSPQL